MRRVFVILLVVAGLLVVGMTISGVIWLTSGVNGTANHRAVEAVVPGATFAPAAPVPGPSPAATTAPTPAPEAEPAPDAPPEAEPAIPPAPEPAPDAPPADTPALAPAATPTQDGAALNVRLHPSEMLIVGTSPSSPPRIEGDDVVIASHLGSVMINSRQSGRHSAPVTVSGLGGVHEIDVTAQSAQYDEHCQCWVFGSDLAHTTIR